MATVNKQTVKNAVNRFLSESNIILTKTTPREKLLEFFRAVKPVYTDHALVRVGGFEDGGYVLPDDFNGVSVCFSPGVFEVANFESELTNRHIPCFLADYSVDGPPIQHELIDFEKKFIGPVESAEYMTLENWIRNKAPGDSEMILQMDIEGAEFGALLSTSNETLGRFRILVIEFHGMDALFQPGGFELIDLTFQKLLQQFDVVHIHPNNCTFPRECMGFAVPPVMEFTFLRKDRITKRTPATTFPHEFDRPNVLNNFDYPLPQCWYQAA